MDFSSETLPWDRDLDREGKRSRRYFEPDPSSKVRSHERPLPDIYSGGFTVNVTGHSKSTCLLLGPATETTITLH